jgi:hypothetical protein
MTYDAILDPCVKVSGVGNDDTWLRRELGNDLPGPLRLYFFYDVPMFSAV